MPHPAFPSDFFGSSGLPRFPWIWFGGQLVSLGPVPDPKLTESSHRFGGPIPMPWTKLPRHLRLHGVLDLDPRRLGLPLPARLTQAVRLPLVFPVRHSGAEIVYDVGAEGRLHLVEGPKSRPDPDWPVPDYPDIIPPRPLVAQAPIPMPLDGLRPKRGGSTGSVQDFPEHAERFLLVVVTANETDLGFSLMGPDAEDSALQLVFLIGPDTGRIWAYNQCT